jgi:hypothetical protein
MFPAAGWDLAAFQHIQREQFVSGAAFAPGPEEQI